MKHINYYNNHSIKLKLNGLGPVFNRAQAAELLNILFLFRSQLREHFLCFIILLIFCVHSFLEPDQVLKHLP